MHRKARQQAERVCCGAMGQRDPNDRPQGMGWSIPLWEPWAGLGTGTTTLHSRNIQATAHLPHQKLGMPPSQKYFPTPLPQSKDGQSTVCNIFWMLRKNPVAYHRLKNTGSNKMERCILKVQWLLTSSKIEKLTILAPHPVTPPNFKEDKCEWPLYFRGLRVGSASIN